MGSEENTIRFLQTNSLLNYVNYIIMFYNQGTPQSHGQRPLSQFYKKKERTPYNVQVKAHKPFVCRSVVSLGLF